MAPYDRKQPVDPNIIAALAKLPKEMKNNEGRVVRIRERAGRETGFEHIAKTGHGLQVRDIKRIPSILLKPDAVRKDPVHSVFNKHYYGKKYRNNKLIGYIKIVTTKNKDGSEQILTLFLTSRLKNDE